MRLIYKGGEQKMVIDIKEGDCVTNIIENFFIKHFTRSLL